jgi:putative ABC transport system permease protein
VTESTARRYFGDLDPIGRTIEVDNAYDVTVAGVAADPPPNSHIQFAALGAWSTIDALSDFVLSNPGRRRRLP